MPVFFDTNVLIYAVDEGEPEKAAVAAGLVEEHLVEGEGMISVQVLREFYAACRRLAHPLPEDRALEMVRSFSEFRTLSEGSGLVIAAALRSQKMSLSFWDALIVESALAGGADTLLTEDLQHGQEIEGLRITNPFA